MKKTKYFGGVFEHPKHHSGVYANTDDYVDDDIIWTSRRRSD